MKELASIVGIIFLPGLIVSILCDKLIVHTVKWDAFKYAIYSFLFGILCYVVLQLICLSPVLVPKCLGFKTSIYILKTWDFFTDGNSLSYIEVLFATLLSPLVAIIAIYIVNHKLINKYGRKYGISNKFGDENLFSYFLNSNDVHWVYIRDKEMGLTYQGALQSFSEANSIQELVLSDVTVFNYEDSEELYSVPLIYLTKPLGKFIIEVIPKSNMEIVNG